MLPLVALVSLWLLDWFVPRVNFGPLAALPIFVLAYRLPRRFVFAATAACAIAFAVADADVRLSSMNLANLAISALALFAAYVIAAWSAQQFVAYRDSVDTLRRDLESREEQADIDFVSGIYNRMYFERTLRENLGLAGDARVGIVIADLDGFKEINDCFGHLTGDAILREVAGRFAASIGARGIVARFGGDEFALILGRLRSARDLATIEDDLRAALETPFALGSKSLTVSASFGSSAYPDDGDSRASLLAAADARMYARKRARRVASGES